MNTSLEAERRLKKVLLHMIQLALVEIRASDNLDTAKALADIFHNLPMMLANSPSDEEDEAIYEKLLERAKRHNMGTYVSGLRAMAEGR